MARIGNLREQASPVDGGAPGAGLEVMTHNAVESDPTQGPGTPAWQRARAVQAQLNANAKKRRN